MQAPLPCAGLTVALLGLGELDGPPQLVVRAPAALLSHVQALLRASDTVPAEDGGCDIACGELGGHERVAKALERGLAGSGARVRRIPRATLSALLEAKAAQSPPPGVAEAQQSELASCWARVPPALRAHLAAFQVAGVAAAFGHRRVLVADEPGLGKTLQAVAVAAAAAALGPVLCVVPKSLKTAFAQELELWLPHLRPCQLHDVEAQEDKLPLLDLPWSDKALRHGQPYGLQPTAAAAAAAGRDWASDPVFVLISPKMVQHLRTEVGRIAFAAAVADETHGYLSEPASGPGSAEAQAVAAVLREIPRVVMLSGTPAVERPFNLWLQMDVLRRGLLGPKPDFGAAYCGGAPYARGEYLDELHQLLHRSGAFLRRTREEVDSVTAPLRRVVHCLPAPLGGTEAELAWLTASPAHRTALRKLPAALRWLRGHLCCCPPGAKLVVFAHHRDVVEQTARALHAALCPPPAAPDSLPYAVIDGSTPARDRGGIVQRFKSCPSLRVVLISVTAGGTGLDFSAAAEGVFLELPGTSGALEQAESRVHRRGCAEAGVTMRYLVGTGPHSGDVAAWTALTRRAGTLLQLHRQAVDDYAALQGIGVDEVIDECCGDAEGVSALAAAPAEAAAVPGTQGGVDAGAFLTSQAVATQGSAVAALAEALHFLYSAKSKHLHAYAPDPAATAGFPGFTRLALLSPTSQQTCIPPPPSHSSDAARLAAVAALPPPFDGSRRARSGVAAFMDALRHLTAEQRRVLDCTGRPLQLAGLHAEVGRLMAAQPRHAPSTLRSVAPSAVRGAPADAPGVFLRRVEVRKGGCTGRPPAKPRFVDVWMEAPPGRSLLCLSCAEQPTILQVPASAAAVASGLIDLFCSHPCHQSYRLRATPRAVRDAVLRRDAGVCAACALDCEELRRTLLPLGAAARLGVLLAKLPALRAEGQAGLLNALAEDPARSKLWEADHITPVHLGGGLCGMDNLRTLCIRCHHAVSAAQARARAVARANAADVPAAAPPAFGPAESDDDFADGAPAPRAVKPTKRKAREGAVL